MWFKKKKVRIGPSVYTRDGFTVGDVVQHKVTGRKAVIVRFDALYEGDEADVTVSIGWHRSEVFGALLAELEPWQRHDGPASDPA